ncbi:hypothetical protein PBR31_00053 [Xanthomonas phage PBR31]|uniref:Uncharacterized protein n=2 Tax=root TaxID=1 RepID=A0A6H0X5U6_9CAUD|nr:hypothetical protein PBR31_00053 [Xanthomonas phage PBR31]QIW89412.1 hypothetical protein PPDBI_00053 [Xanthomonas phage PPDBI]
MNALVELPQMQLMSADQMRERINAVQKVMGAVMKDGTHFGTIPGTQKPTLYKAGSEVLLTTFHMGLRLEIEDLSDSDCIRYRVKAIGFHQPTGTAVGEGIGECSTGEEKYKWRTAVCEEEFDFYPESRKRVKFQKVWNKGQRRYDFMQIKQVRTEPADLANTVLKMAKKRAQIDFTLTALGASDIFTQDIEDLPEELRPAADDDGNPVQPGNPIEHPAMKEAKSVQDLAKIMNTLKADERKKYLPYFQVRQKELSEASNGTAD